LRRDVCLLPDATERTDNVQQIGVLALLTRWCAEELPAPNQMFSKDGDYYF